MQGKFIATLSALVFMFLGVIKVAAQGPPDNAAVQQISAAFTAAVNKGDGKAAAALFTSDGDYVSSTGRVAQGPAEIEKLVVDQAAGAFKGTTFKTETLTVRSVHADVAIANGTFEAAGATTRKGMTTIVLVRQAGAWKIAALRAMSPLTPARP
jgi:uncharacterized protein (TIGR02246 family)